MDLAFRRSTSQRRMFRTCGKKFLLKYGHGWASRVNRGTYAFGDTAQHVWDAIITGAVKTPAEAEALFATLWAPFEKDPTRSWTSRASWALLAQRGPLLVRAVFPQLLLCVGGVRPADTIWLNKRLTYKIGGEVDELAIPDYVGPWLAGSWAKGTTYEGKLLTSVIDFKSGDREYDETAAELDEQLTDYQLGWDVARPIPQLGLIQQVGLVVTIYSAVPKVQHLIEPRRSDAELSTFVGGAVQTDRDIRAERFLRNDRACTAMGRCEFMGLCFASQAAERDKVLVQDARKAQVDVEVDW